MVEYEAPRADVCGAFFMEELAVSYVPIIKNGTVEYYEFGDYGNVQTQDGKDVVIF
jgi:hypothetical protein